MASNFPVIAVAETPTLHRDDFWLPESPVHDAETGLTWFTDIPSKALYSFDVNIGQESLKRYDVEDYVGCVFLIDGDKEHLAVAAKKGIAKFHIATGKLSYLNTFYPDSVELQEKMRTNDGAVDSEGRIWVGVMRSFGLGPPQTEGAVFVSTPALSLTTIKSPVAVPNGLAFSPDNTTLYFCETRLSTIFAYDFSPATGAISNERVFIKFTPEAYGPGAPDGLAISEDGDLWVALFGGNRVLRIDPATKEVKGSIEVPRSKQVACPRFAGEGLVITTGALVHMEPDLRTTSPHAGDVFYVPLPGVRGREIYKAKFE